MSTTNRKSHAQPKAGEKLFREMTAAVVSSDGPVIVRVSDESTDRYDSEIKVDGWMLDAYRKNPVVLWAHDDRMPPIGRAAKVWIEDKALKSECEFAPTEFARMVEQLVRGKFLNAVSAGWMTHEWGIDEERDVLVFRKQELIEYSWVPCPGNANALVEARAAGIEMRPWGDWADRAMRELHGEGSWIAAATIEKALRKLDKERRAARKAKAPVIAPVIAPPPAPLSLDEIAKTLDRTLGSLRTTN